MRVELSTHHFQVRTKILPLKKSARGSTQPQVYVMWICVWESNECVCVRARVVCFEFFWVKYELFLIKFFVNLLVLLLFWPFKTMTQSFDSFSVIVFRFRRHNIRGCVMVRSKKVSAERVLIRNFHRPFKATNEQQ